jgi:hypothetical protein
MEESFFVEDGFGLSRCFRAFFFTNEVTAGGGMMFEFIVLFFIVLYCVYLLRYSTRIERSLQRCDGSC